jgi:hypothetical protein
MEHDCDRKNAATNFIRPAEHYILFGLMRDQEIFYKQQTLYKCTGQVIKSVFREQILNESSQKLTLIQRKRTIRQHN